MEHGWQHCGGAPVAEGVGVEAAGNVCFREARDVLGHEMVQGVPY